jgi:glycyl-tRNA synthetase
VASTTVDRVLALARRRGFLYPGSQVYDGAPAGGDYGPLGVELKENLRRAWWHAVVRSREDVVGLDSAAILPAEVWAASGHEEALLEELTECRSCHRRFRADRLRREHAARRHVADPDTLDDESLACPACGTRGAWADPVRVSGLLSTRLGADEHAGAHYLRPEITQGIVLHFAQVVASQRMRPPFGIAQVGHVFRNELAPREALRSHEREQMELAYFVPPGAVAEWHEYWVDERSRWYADLGLRTDHVRTRARPRDEDGHGARRTVELEYRFGLAGEEWGAVEAVVDRGDRDLSTHARHSGRDLRYQDQVTGDRWVPHVAGAVAGLDRGLLAFLVDAYDEEEAPHGTGAAGPRTVLRLHPRLAPVKVAVLPLSRNAELSPRARGLATALRAHWPVEFDDAGAIGRRYRRQDEVGTPWCVTVDFDTLDDDAVTVRERDSMRQQRVGLDQVTAYLSERLLGC